MLFRSLPDALEQAATDSSKGITFIENTDNYAFLSYAALQQSALLALGVLQQKGIKRGSELVFQVENNQTFLIAFWACVLGGIIPVPLTVGATEEHRKKIFSVWPILHDPWLLASAEQSDRIQELGVTATSSIPELSLTDHWVNTETLLNSAIPGKPVNAHPDDIAFIQFSSGSTGSPKGVVLTHRNLLINVAAIAAAAAYTTADSLLSWMPLTHDMGLIGFHLNPLYCGIHQYLIPTANFVRRPALWLDAATQFGATILCSPNFGYEYTLKHCQLAASKQSWSLSSVRVIYNGAEPISEKVCDRFITALEPYGLDPAAMCPVYGLAEASLAVTVSTLTDPVKTIRVDRSRLGIGDAIAQAVQPSGAVAIVNVGRPVNDVELRIADDEGRELPEAHVGHILIRGTAVTWGYYNNPTATREVSRGDGWLQTGDLGFLQDGCLFVTGRVKDIFFVNGQNFYPHDIERIAEAVPGIELNKIAIAGCFNPDTQQEEIIAFVFHRGSITPFLPVARHLRQYLSVQTGIQCSAIIPVKDIPRTTSGKLQRFKLLEQYRSGAFEETIRAMEALQNQLSASIDTSALSALEQGLHKIWQKVLASQQVDPALDFFQNGGTSLRSAEMLMHVWKAYGTSIAHQDFFNAPTLHGLASLVSKATPGTYADLPTAPIQAWYAAGDAQKRLYYHWALNPSSTTYNIPVLLQLTGQPDVAWLNQCINDLYAQHEALRISFVLHDIPVFRISETAGINLTEHDCHNKDVHQLLSQLVQPFDLHNGPLFRAHLLHSNETIKFLLLDFHHSIADGISVHLFVQQLLQRYNKQPLSPLSTTFKDFLVFASQQLPKWEAYSAAYWLDKLSADRPALHWPLSHPRPKLFDHRGKKYFFSIDPALTIRIDEVTQQLHCTRHILLLTIYRILLWKYTGQEDLTIGIPVSGRSHPDTLDLFGMLVNTLAIRMPLSSETGFGATVQQAHAAMQVALTHSDYPFGELIRQLNEKTDSSRNPVFDTMFLYQDMLTAFPATTDFSTQYAAFDSGTSKFDLSLEIIDRGTTLDAALEYATALFDDAMISRMAVHFTTLLSALLEDTTRALAQITILTPKEYQAQVVAFNQTTTSYPTGKTVYDLFAAQAANKPNHTALYVDNITISYSSLFAEVQALTRRLRQRGVQSGVVVGICMHRSPRLITALLAVLQAGGAYLPIDTSLPQERIRYMIGNSGCTLILSDNDFGYTLASILATMPAPLNLMNVASADNDSRQTIPLKATVPGETAYVLYTSGTTGYPKGVLIGQQALLNYVNWAAKQYIREPAAVFPLFTSISFDLTITSIFPALVTGNAIAIYAETEGELLIEKVIEDNISTVVKLTPAHLRIMLKTKVWQRITTPSIRRLIAGGEQLDWQLANDMYNLLNKQVTIINEYGPTETTVGCMIHVFDPGEHHSAVPIGVPGDNVQIYVLDKQGHPVPTGVEGDLFIAGDGLAMGYLANPDATTQKFINNPFTPGTRMYQSGDVAKWLDSGVLAYVGRSDEQVKINGYRVEPAEIAQLLATSEWIDEAVVVVKKINPDTPVLIAYYTSATATDESLITQYLLPRLPHYMLPAKYIRLEKIPLTTNGKVNIGALPEPISDIPDTLSEKDNYSPIEATMIAVWEDVLETSPVRTDSHFFELGGDSIKAVQVTARLLEKGIAIRSKDILTWHTIAQIIQHLPVVAVHKSYCQESLTGNLKPWPAAAWFLAQAFPHPGHYNHTILLDCKKNIHPDLLVRTFELLLRRHDALRLNYNSSEQLFFYNPLHLHTRFTITREQTMASKDAAVILSTYKKGHHAAFNLEQDCLIRAVLIEYRSTTPMLIITAHHLVVDGISWRILLYDLYRFYNALEEDPGYTAFPPKTASLLDWEEARNKTSPGLVARDRGNVKNTVLPGQNVSLTDRSTLHYDTLTICPDLTALDFLLKTAPAQFKISTETLLLGAFLEVLQQQTGNSGFDLLLENHGRYPDTLDLSATVGWFTAMHHCYVDWSATTFLDRLFALHEQTSILSAATVDMKDAAIAIPGMRFNYLGHFGRELDNALFAFHPASAGLNTHPDNPATTLLDINVMVVQDRLQLSLCFHTQYYPASMIQQLIPAWVRLLEEAPVWLMHENCKETLPALKYVDLDEQEMDALFQ
jgi:amino acid adenylation domain-containing protein/non-ribosomal peptide synthase protein (TIGR01720 family)